MMKSSDLIGIISLVLGIPGFIVLFFTGKTALAVLTLLFVATIVGASFWYGNDQKKPMITQLEVEKTLTFIEPDARARLVQNVRARANHKGLTEYWIGNIGAEGSVENITINNSPPDLEEKLLEDLRIGIRFQPPKNRGDEFRVEVKFDAINCFPSEKEGLIHIVDHETEKLKIVVNFNPAKPAIGAWTTLRFGGEIFEENIPKPELSQDGLKIIYEMKKPKFGGQYFIEWRWHNISSP